MPDAANQIGVVTIAHGNAIAEGPDGIRQLSPDSPVFADEVIKTTGDGSALEIQFNDGALLSQGPNSSILLDTYVYNPDQSSGEMAVKLLEGTLRSVTGEIVDMNPEGFQIETPLATIGIRGTTTGHMIGPDGQEEHVVVDFVDKPVVIRPAAGGPIRVVTQDGMGVSATNSGLGGVRPAPSNVLSDLNQLSSGSLKDSAPTMKSGSGPDNEEGQGEGEQQGEGGEQQGQGPAQQGEGGEGPQEATGEPVHPQPEPVATQPGPIAPQPQIIQPVITQQVVQGPIPQPVGQPLPQPVPQPVVQPLFQPAQQVKIAPKVALPAQEDVPTPEVDPDDNTPTVELPISNGTLDLSSQTTNMTVNFFGTQYFKTTGSTSLTEFPDEVHNAIGSSTHSNIMTGDWYANVLTGGSASDVIAASSGNDTVYGTLGSDNISGGSGTDLITYENLSSSVTINLGTSSASSPVGSPAFIDGITSFENAKGTQYNDIITGSSSSNALYGLGGNDQLSGGTGGDDSLYGGSGNDTFTFENVTSLAGGTINGGSGTDQIEIHGSGNNDLTGLDSVVNIESFLFKDNGASVTVETGDFSNSDGTDVAPIVKVNSLNGTKERLTLNETSGDGIDLSDTTFVNWEAGIDEIIINGSSSSDDLTGSTYNDTIMAGNGDDTVNGSGGGDSLDGGAGRDRISYNEMTTGVEVDLSASTAKYPTPDLNTTDTITNFEDVTGSDYDDTIYGDSNDNLLHGANGADLIEGNGGVDTLIGGSGNDRFKFHDVTALTGGQIDGGAGTDRIEIWGNGSNDLTGLTSVTNVEGIYFNDDNGTVTLSTAAFGELGGDGLDLTIESQSDNGTGEKLIIKVDAGDKVDLTSANFINWEWLQDEIRIDGSSSNDTITGSKFKDTILAANGNDTIFGSEGGDSFDGGNGVDVLSYENFTFGINAYIGGGTVKYPDNSNDYTDNISNIESIIGTDYDDTIWGDSADNALYGGDGTDLLWGSSGVDSLYGGDGTDRIKFHDVASLSGGIVDGGSGTDRIEIWGSSTNDLTGLDSITNVEAIHFLADGASATFEVDDFTDPDLNEAIPEIQVNSSNSTTETLNLVMSTAQDVDLTAVTFDNWESDYDKISITGSGQNDTLKGSMFKDTIDGGAGNDKIKGSAGDDNLDGGTGTDTLTYIHATSGITVDLDGTVSDDGEGGTDTISNFEIFEATNEIDSIQTSANTTSYQQVYARAGNDVIIYTGNVNGQKTKMDAGFGDDKLILENDVVTGSSFIGCAGTDTLVAENESTIDATALAISDIEALDILGTTTLKLSSDAINGKTWSTQIEDGSMLEIYGDTSDNSVDLSQLNFTAFDGDLKVFTDDGNDTIDVDEISTLFEIDGGDGNDELTIQSMADSTSLNRVTNVESIVFENANITVDTLNQLVASGETLNVDARAITTGNTFTWHGQNESDGTFNIHAAEGVNAIVGSSLADTFHLYDDLDVGSNINGGSGNDRIIAQADLTIDDTSSLTSIQELELDEDVTLTIDWDMETFINDLDNFFGFSGGGDETLKITDNGTDNSLNLSSSSATFGNWSGNDAIIIEGLDGDDDIISWNQASQILGGAGDDHLFGGDANDTISGGIGADCIHGEDGIDMLTGGAGADTFYYSTGAHGGDVISDFDKADDSFMFDSDTFTGLPYGFLASDKFKEISDASYAGNGSSGIDGNDSFVYLNTGSTFELYYDSNGSGADGQELIASFTSDVELTEADIFIE